MGGMLCYASMRMCWRRERGLTGISTRLMQTSTGRRITTVSSHLQPVTSLAVDSSSNFILSGSSDASIQVWSLVDLLSFTEPSGRIRQQPTSAIRVFPSHRAPITSLALGHSAGRYNIAFSTSEDRTAIAWDYHTGQVLRIFLLPMTPLCATLDPVDRAAYVGYGDGSVQIIDFYRSQSVQHLLYDPSLQSTPSQLSEESRWTPPSPDLDAVESLSLSYDGMTLLSGHRSGKLLSWNVARQRYASTVTDYTHPITNLMTLPPTGLPRNPSRELKRIRHTIVKPRSDFAFTDLSNPAGAIPADYAFNTHIIDSAQTKSSSSTTDSTSKPDEFSQALSRAFFPTSMIEEGLAELASLRLSPPSANGVQPTTTPSQNQTHQNDTNEETDATTNNTAELKSLKTEITTLQQAAKIDETARQSTTDEAVKLRSQLANLQDYVDEMHWKQEEARQGKLMRRARKEERDARKREAWFEAEKKGRKGDRVIKEMEVEDDEVTSETDEQSSDDD